MALRVWAFFCQNNYPADFAFQRAFECAARLRLTIISYDFESRIQIGLRFQNRVLATGSGPLMYVGEFVIPAFDFVWRSNHPCRLQNPANRMLSRILS